MVKPYPTAADRGTVGGLHGPAIDPRSAWFYGVENGRKRPKVVDSARERDRGCRRVDSNV